MKKGLIKVMIAMAAGLLLSTMCLGSAFAVEVENEDFGITIASTVEQQVAVIKREPMNILTIIGGAVSIFGALFEKYISTGEPGVLALNSSDGLLMVDGVILDLDAIVFTWGYVFPTDNPSLGEIADGGWSLGLKARFDKIDFTKNIQILKDLNPGICYYKKNVYIILGIDLFEND